MLKINTDSYEIDVKMYENEIGMNGFDIYIDTGLFIKRLYEAASVVTTLEEEMSSLIQYYSAGKYTGTHKDNLCRTLIYLGVPERMVLKGSRYIFNLDDTLPSIRRYCDNEYIFNPYKSNNIRLLTNCYEKLSKAKTYFNSMNKLNDRLDTSDVKGFNGACLSTISSMYTKKVTGRYYTENYNLQGWNKSSVDCFTVPEDYFLIWADFSQIDFRVACNMILFNNNPELRQLFEQTDDKYEGFVRMLYKDAGKEFKYDEFLANRPGYKTSVLAALYGAGEDVIVKSFKDPQCARMLMDFFNKNPERNEYIDRLKDALNYSAEVRCIDYFGQVNRVPITNNNNHFVKSHELNSINNNSIQSTSNSVIMTWCVEVTKRFRELGFGADKFKAYLNRHDEMLFMAHKDILPHLWILKDYSELAIDDWTVLTVEPNFGYNYKIESETLTKAYEESCTLNSINIKPYQKGEPRKNPYIHCEKCITLTSLAPVMPSEFITTCCNWHPFFKEHIDEIVELHKKNIKSGIVRAQELLKEYLDNIEYQKEDNVLYELVKGYRIFGYSYYWVDDNGETQHIPSSNLFKFLKDNNYGYVQIDNYAKTDYIIVDDIQFKYKKNDFYPDIVSKIPGYFDEVKS